MSTRDSASTSSSYYGDTKSENERLRTMLRDLLSGFPEVSTPTIIIVGASCGVLILILVVILVYFCCRRRSRPKEYSDTNSSPQRRLQPDLNTNSYKSYHQKPYAMVSPHPSLTSTEETVVDHNKVFTTLLSANHPLNGGNNQCTELPEYIQLNSNDDYDCSAGSDSSATMFLNSNGRPPKKVIYEVVV